MTQHRPIITILGGTGFLGRYVVNHLAHAGYRLRIVTRNPDGALPLKTAGDPGQISLITGNLTRPEELKPALSNAYAVINLVGILFESSGEKFEALHAKGPETLARMAKVAGVERFIHVSALGVDKAFGSHYARTKLTGEKAVLAAFPEATILRPGVMFGAEDNFFNQFAAMPALPLINGGKSRFQPVYVDDVAAAITHALERPESKGEVYELAGATTYSFKALLDFVCATLRRKKPMIPLPMGLAKCVAFASELGYRLVPFIRRPLLTRDQLRLLAYPNVHTPGVKGLHELGITPKPLEEIVPHYLARYNPQKVL